MQDVLVYGAGWLAHVLEHVYQRHKQWIVTVMPIISRQVNGILSLLFLDLVYVW